MPHQDPLELVTTRFRQLMLLTGATGFVMLACGVLKMTKYRLRETFDVGVPCIVSAAVALVTSFWYAIVVYKAGKCIAWPVRMHFHAAKVTMLYYVIVVGVVVYNITMQDPTKQSEDVNEQVLNDSQTIKILFIAATTFNVVLLIASMRTIFLYGHHLGVILSPGLLCRDNPGVRSVAVDIHHNTHGHVGRGVLVYTPNSTPKHVMSNHHAHADVDLDCVGLKSKHMDNNSLPATPPPSYQETDEEKL